MNSLLIVINEEYLSKGIALALMDYFPSIHTTKNPFEAIELVRKGKIDTIITELCFNTLESREYTTKLIDAMSLQCTLIIIKDSPLEINKISSKQNIIIQQKPISIKKIISIINSIKENSIKTKKEET